MGLLLSITSSGTLAFDVMKNLLTDPVCDLSVLFSFGPWVGVGCWLCRIIR
jgi:hypothetical protein